MRSSSVAVLLTVSLEHTHADGTRLCVAAALHCFPQRATFGSGLSQAEDEEGWQLLFRQTSPFVWPRGKLDLCKFDHLSDNFAKLSESLYIAERR